MGIQDSLVLDVALSKYQFGSANSIEIWDTGIPLVWRPKVEIKSRLYNFKNKKLISTFEITKKMPWMKYFTHIFFKSADIIPLLNEAIIELKRQVNKTIDL